MTQAVPNSTVVDAFGRAYLDYVRNLTPQVILLVAVILSYAQAVATCTDKLMWMTITLICIATAALALIFNIVFFIRDSATSSRSPLARKVVKLVAGILSVAAPFVFVAAALFNAHALSRSLFSNVAGC